MASSNPILGRGWHVDISSSKISQFTNMTFTLRDSKKGAELIEIYKEDEYFDSFGLENDNSITYRFEEYGFYTIFNGDGSVTQWTVEKSYFNFMNVERLFVNGGEIRRLEDSLGQILFDNFSDNILYAPLLNGTETVYTIPYDVNGTSINFQPTISNNQLKDGAGYLSDGWDNTVNWELTFEYYVTGDNNGYLVIPQGTTSRDYNGVQQWRNKQLNFKVQGSSPSGNLSNAGLSTNTWNSVRITKVDYVWTVYYNDTQVTSWDSSSYSSIVDTWTTMCIGLDKNMSRNSAVIRNILVKEI